MLNLLFLLLLPVLALLLLAALFGGRLTPLESRTTLVFAPEGRLVEQYTCDALSRSLAHATHSRDCQEVRLRDVLSALHAARTGQAHRTCGERAGHGTLRFASLREVGAALAAVRAAGSGVVAYGDSFSQGQYLLAAQANEIYLDPMSSGGVMLDGLACTASSSTPRCKTSWAWTCTCSR